VSFDTCHLVPKLEEHHIGARWRSPLYKKMRFKLSHSLRDKLW